METDTMQNPLIKLYGLNAIESALQEIKKLKDNSNIPFDKKYVKLGISFIMIKANEIVEENKKIPSLRGLVSESFGEAAIYKYNICGETIK